MKNEDVLSKCMLKEIVKKGAMFDNGQIVVPVEYQFVSRAKHNLFVATKGSVNGYRTYGIEATFEEKDKPYGEYFNEQLKNRTLDTEVHFYTIKGKIHMNKKIIACIACMNDDMIILLDCNYRWSIALIDYDNMTIIQVGMYSELEYLKSDYFKSRFVIRKDGRYSVITFDDKSKASVSVADFTYEPVKFTEEGLIIKDSEKFGFMKNDGEILLHCNWDEVLPKEEYIKAKSGNITAIYLYDGTCIVHEEIKSCETLYIKRQILFKVQYKNGNFGLYSLSKKLHPLEAASLEIISDGTIIAGMKENSYALLKYDVVCDKMIPILPDKFYPSETNLFDSMRFIMRKDKTMVEARKGKVVFYYDTDSKEVSQHRVY